MKTKRLGLRNIEKLIDKLTVRLQEREAEEQRAKIWKDRS